MLKLAFIALLTTAAAAQTPVHVTVDAAHATGPYHSIWNYFGADEPNYTYTPNGTRLLTELSRLDPATPVYFRPHNLLTTGDGTAALKWGSTNVYTEAPDGSPVYDWTITDKLFDNLAATHVRPMVEIGFTPKALSPHPDPYQHGFPANPDVFTGWSYPPRDYAKWRALLVAWVTHLHQRYGAAVDTWQWEVWNEPDIGYFHGTPEEYFKLYDISTAAVRQVLAHAQVGGPAVTGGGDNKHFLQLFLEHCARGLNADTGALAGTRGAPLDFISFHPKGSPKFIAATADAPAHVQMNLARQLQLTDRGFATIATFPEYRNTPIILSETDPEGCAACKGPQNGYRNGPLYGVSVAEMLVRSAELARKRGVNLAGALTWAFEFEDQPPFAGFRELATNVPLTTGGATIIDKPVLSVFRQFGLMGSQAELLPFNSTAALPLDKVTASSAAGLTDVAGFATRHANTVDVLIFNYSDTDLPAPAQAVTLDITGLPAKAVVITQYLMDQTHANAYTAWQSMGSPQTLTPAQAEALRKASALIPVETTATPIHGTLSLGSTLPLQGVTLFHLEQSKVANRSKIKP